MSIQVSKFDFNIVKRQPAPKKQPRKPKRIVAPSDILSAPSRARTPRQNTTRPVVAKHKPSLQLQAVKQPGEVAMPSVLSRVMPAVALMLVFALIVQTGSYLWQARDTGGLVLGSATTAYENLDDASKSLNEMDFGTARKSFDSAQDSLATAQAELNKFWLLTAVAPQARGADNVLRGASFLAEAGKNLTRALQLFDELTVGSAGISTENFTSKLQDNHNLLKNSRLMLEYALQNFDSASGLPREYEATLEQARSQITTLSAVLDNLISLEDLFLSFFGSEPKTYLLVFQNYDEMRATGGFIGTYGVLKYQDGIINQLKIESVYNIDGSLTKQIAAPGPFQPDIKKWALRDANWFADFPTSAQIMLEFFEMESQTADGVIALTPQVFEDILRLVGDIRMDQYDVVLTPENFQEVVQTKTSYEYDKELNQPKKFLHDFAPVLLNRMSALGQEQWFAMFQILKDNFHQKHIMMYSADPEVQGKISAMNYDGRILDAPHDYLAVFNSNHSGTKTDLSVDQSVHVVSTIRADGAIQNSVTITRKNNATDAVNGNFMRVLIPKDSVITKAEGFLDKPQHTSTAEGYLTHPALQAWDQSSQLGHAKIRSESGKTAVTGWVDTEPGSESVVTIEYTLPFLARTHFLKPTQAHSFLFQKQAGTKQSPVRFELVGEGSHVNGKSRVTFQGTGQTDELWYAKITR